MRVGYCQGNFNSDNCAAGGFTLDYGPFGFCELFRAQISALDRRRPSIFHSSTNRWQPKPTIRCSGPPSDCCSMATPKPWRGWIRSTMASLKRLTLEIEAMWAKKLGLIHYDPTLVNELLELPGSLQG